MNTTTHENITLIQTFTRHARLPAASPFEHPFPQCHETISHNIGTSNSTYNRPSDIPPSYTTYASPNDLRYLWRSNSEGVNFAPGSSNYRPATTRDIQHSLRRSVSAPRHPPSIREPSPSYSTSVNGAQMGCNADLVVSVRRRDKVRRLGSRLVLEIKNLRLKAKGNKRNGAE